MNGAQHGRLRTKLSKIEVVANWCEVGYKTGVSPHPTSQGLLIDSSWHVDFFAVEPNPVCLEESVRDQAPRWIELSTNSSHNVLMQAKITCVSRSTLVHQCLVYLFIIVH